MSEAPIRKEAFEHDGLTYEVWIQKDNAERAFRVSVRLDGCPIALEFADKEWASMAYVVTVENEVDARIDNLTSLLSSAIEIAKSDLDKPHRKVTDNG